MFRSISDYDEHRRPVTAIELGRPTRMGAHRPSRPGRRDSVYLLDIPGLAEHLGVTERFVRRLVDERRIPFLKIGKFVRFNPDEIADWVSARRVEACRF